MKTLDEQLATLRAASSMQTALLTALFIHHPKNVRVLDSFSRMCEQAQSALLASQNSDLELAAHQESQQAWMDVLRPLAGM